MEVQVLSAAPFMFYIHEDKTKLFPKYRHMLCVFFIGETEPAKFEINSEDVMSIDQCDKKWFITQDGFRINMNNINAYMFDTEVWVNVQPGVFGWTSLTKFLLDKMMCDDGQALLMKREMNIG